MIGFFRAPTLNVSLPKKKRSFNSPIEIEYETPLVSSEATLEHHEDGHCQGKHQAAHARD